MKAPSIMVRPLSLLAVLLAAVTLQGQELSIARVSDRTVEIRFGQPDATLPASPMLVDYSREEKWHGRIADAPPSIATGPLRVDVNREPLTIRLRRTDGSLMQELRVDATNGELSFDMHKAVFGLGENGWRFDRRGGQYPMTPRWGGGTQGSVLPSPLLIGPDGWALFIPQPQGAFDLRGDRGKFVAAKPEHALHCFAIAWQQPSDVLAEYVRLTGHPVMPPKWALGYMQSHRTLAGPQEVLAEAKTFREKRLPCDALIYLGTGYCPAGWNKGHGSLEFNPKIFEEPAEMIRALHADDFKVVLHVNRPPKDLHGASIREAVDGPNHIRDYWQRHRVVFALGVDGWWPDDGDELSDAGRLARHRCYFEGPLNDRPNERPWSIHRTGTAGMARYGGWFWSGDIDSSWGTLTAQVPVGLAASLSLSPFWGSDIGGFHLKREYTGELFVRWFQFAAFTPSFRAHGRDWHLHRPWGWNTGQIGPDEWHEKPDPAEFHNAHVEPACREALNLRYQLLPYNYTLAREACDTGLPMMRALWLHYPDDAEAAKHTDEFLWGRDLLIAPVVVKGGTTRQVYLPAGTWFDWWTGEKLAGGKTIHRDVTLKTIPIFVRAGGIIPLDPVRQFTGQAVTEPTQLRIYPGADGDYTLYDDDGHSLDYLKSDGNRIHFHWSDAAQTLTIDPANEGGAKAMRAFNLRVVPGKQTTSLRFEGTKITSSITRTQ
jgi:alpha-glucosidase (family GH31 glycosyl hydrolase)